MFLPRLEVKRGILFVFLALALVGIVYWQVREGSPSSYPELSQISELTPDFKSVSGFFQKLAQEKGGAYAYEVLQQAPLPSNIDLHLLGHVVGDELYAQQGIDGIKVCTHDFRNACSHSIVIGAFLEYGEGAIDKIQEACHQAPGGKGAYTMCFHGFGHGVLSYFGYDLPVAIQTCEKVGTPEYRNREYVECVGGTVMELQSGVYDPVTWQEKKDEYFKSGDPLYPCTADFMPSGVRDICYIYLTPHLFDVAGADASRPGPADFAKAFRYCDGAPTQRDREVCWGSFGKEFIVLAQNRDIREIESMTDEQLQAVYEWCTLAEVQNGISACAVSAVESLYWGGENDRHPAVRFCSLIPDNLAQRACVEDLTQAVHRYIDDARYYRAFCNEIPAVFGEYCRRELSIDA